MGKNIFKRLIICILALALVVHIPQVSPVCVVKADAFEDSIKSFPDSYKPYLRNLHKKYPKWKFIPYNTNLKFKTVVNKEYENNKSLIENSSSNYLKSNASGDYKGGKYIAKDGGSWVSASKNCIAYFVDPRNFLNDTHIYMFEKLSFDSSEQTAEGVEAILQGSFMYKTAIGYLTASGAYKNTGTNYSTQIMTAAKLSQVSAYYIASKILQEIGTRKNDKYSGMGASGSINGNYSSTYKGIYNFYNIGAYSGANPIANGLNWAKSGTTYSRPWNTPIKSINGGAAYIGESYINCGQNTTYYQRFNVNNSSKYSLYSHQYMTNIYGAANEAALTADAHESLNIASHAKTFIIPVYTSMPANGTTVTLGSSKTKNATVSSDVNLRKGAGTSYESIVMIPKKSRVQVLDGCRINSIFNYKFLSNPYWFKVKYSVGKKSYTGYVAASFLTFDVELNFLKGTKTKAPKSLSHSETIYYRSTTPSVASISAAGNVNAKKVGKTTLFTFTEAGDVCATRIQVLETGVALNASSGTLKVGSSKTLKATVAPANAKDKTVTFTTSNKNVATVSKKGKVVAKAPGLAVITASAKVGGIKSTYKVRVIPTPVALNTYQLDGSKAVLTWKKRAKDTGYKVYRKSGKKYKKIATVLSNRGWYIDYNRGYNKSYSYKIKAYKSVNKVDYNSAYSNVATARIILPPTKLKATKKKNSVKLKWTASKQASGYIIYVKKPGKTKFSKLKTIKNNKTKSYKHKKVLLKGQYSYKIVLYRTIKKKKCYGLDSNTVNIKK